MEGLQEIKKRLYKFDKGRQSKLLEKWASKLKLQQIILENSEKVQWIFINSFNWSAITQINNNHWRQTKIKSHKRFLCKCGWNTDSQVGTSTTYSQVPHLQCYTVCFVSNTRCIIVQESFHFVSKTWKIIVYLMTFY